MRTSCCPACNSSFSVGTNYSSPGPGPGRPRQYASKCPLLLKCGHTFCESCLVQKIKRSTVVVDNRNVTQATITCMICGENTLLPNGVITDLHPNIYLTASIQSNKTTKWEQQLNGFVPAPTKKLLQRALAEVSKDTSQKMCSMCEKKKATCECKECENILCSECFNMAHRVSAAIRHHKPIPYVQEPEAASKEPTVCKLHNRPLEYFCTQCNVPICSKCYITGDHQNHPIVSFEEKNQEYLEQIQLQMPAANTVFHNLKRVDKKLLATMPAYKSEARAIFEKINATFLTLHSLLQTKEMEMIEKVTLAYNTGLQTLEDHRQNFEHTKHSLESTMKKARALIENNSMMVDAKLILDELVAAKDNPCVVDEIPENKEKLQFLENGTKEILDAIQLFGSVVGDMNNKVRFRKAEVNTNVDDTDDTESISSMSSALSSSKDVARSGSSIILDTDSDASVAVDFLHVEDTDADNCTTSTRLGRPVSNKSKQYKETISMPAVKGPPHKVLVTTANSPSSFYVQLVSNRKKISTMSHNINIWCKSPSAKKFVPLALERNMLVLAKFSVDKKWYRARVLNVEDKADSGKSGFQVRVSYIDYGNEEEVDIKDLITMQDRFMVYPEFKVHCSLFDILPVDENKSWDAETIKEFEKLTTDQVLMMNAIEKSIDGLEVDLTYMPSENVSDDLFVSVRDVLIFLELARFKHHSDQSRYQSKPSYSKEEFISATRLERGCIVEADIIHAVSPSDFYIVGKGEERDYYISMMDTIQSLYNGGSSKLFMLYYPRKDVLCVAKGQDDKWYRAKVLAPPIKRQVMVKLVDTGEEITVHYDLLRKLHSDFVRLPVQAVHCRLADVSPVGGLDCEWSEEAKLWCSTVLPTSCASLRLISWDAVSDVVLWLGPDKNCSRESSINALLVFNGLADKSGPSGNTSGVDPEEILPMAPQRFKNVTPRKKRLSTSSSSSQSTITSPVRPISHNTTPVVSPNTFPKSPRKSPEKAMVDEKLVPVDCEFEAPIGSRNLRANRRQRPPLVSEKLNLKSKDVKKSEPKSAPVLKEKDAYITPEDQAKVKIQQEIHRAVSIEENESEKHSYKNPIYVQIIIPYFKSPSDFRIRITEKEEELHQLMMALQKVYINSDADKTDLNLSPGSACAVRNPEDKKWYRGNVEKMDGLDSAVVVELVDYGRNVEVTFEDLRQLPSEFCQTKAAAHRCCISDLVPAGTSDRHKWSRTAVDFMAGQIFDKTLYVKLAGDEGDEGVPVDIIIEEVIPETAFDPASRNYHSLRQLILDEGLAMSSKHRSPEPSADGENPFLRKVFEKYIDDKSLEEDEHVLEFENIAEADAAGDPGFDAKLAEILELPDLPELSPGQEIVVMPTYVGHDGIIHSQPMDWTDSIVAMSQELQTTYQKFSSVAKVRHVAWKVNQLCVAKFPDDDLWYRARIMEVKPKSVKVFYIDYGNTAHIEANHLREIHPAFMKIHQLALPCVLLDAEPSSGDGYWPTPVLTHLHELVVNHECVVTVQQVVQTQIMVSLKTDSGVNFPEYLFREKLAIDGDDLSESYKTSGIVGPVWTQNNPYIQLNVSDFGTEFLAITTHVELPNLVYLQRLRIPESKGVDIVTSGEVCEVNGQITEFEEMAENLNASNSMPLTKLPDVGIRCAAKYSLDECWYRALCVEPHPVTDSCLLVFVDYGTTEEVPRSNMRILPMEFWNIPAQSIRCYFNIVPPLENGGIFRKSTYNGVFQVLTNKELVVRVKQKSPLTVELLQDTGKDNLSLAYEELISSGLALLPAEVEAAHVMKAKQAEEDDPEVEVELEEDIAESEQGAAAAVVSIEEGSLSEPHDEPLVSSEAGGSMKIENISESTHAATTTAAKNEGSNVDWFEIYDGDGNVNVTDAAPVDVNDLD